VQAQVWRAQVGRVPLYLLDANIEANSPADRELTSQLYGGDKETRIRQEILLGIGGYRALKRLGLAPAVFHLNEGHAAFQVLERARRLMQEEGLSFAEAVEAVRAGTVFTTHTPVAAGHDKFSPELMERYFGQFRGELGLDKREFLALGRNGPEDDGEPFNMTHLALRLSSRSNGVSVLHGEVSRQMWNPAWPGFLTEEDSITNGIHIRSWISFDLVDLFDRYLGPRWITKPVDQTVWERVDTIPDTELWRTHARRRERLVVFSRRRLRAQLHARGLPPADVAVADEVLDPEALTIGFARRFATYKRGTLLFKDLERLAGILNDPKRPVQIIFAGKAHPADTTGKEFIREIIHHCRTERFRHHVVFLEDYDMKVARYIVQGVDVWLNNPRRKMEASGTSGMKATANGALNMSIPDGWWCEGFDGENGWCIGLGEDYADHDFQDKVESQAIYEMLEDEVVPLFFDRGPDGVPRRWVARMKHAMRTICPFFNTNRMVQEYAEQFYLPTVQRFRSFQADGWQQARDLASWKSRVGGAWPKVRIRKVDTEDGARVRVGEALRVQADVHLGSVGPGDVAVEIYCGPVDNQGNIVGGESVEMNHLKQLGHGNHLFEGAVSCSASGQHGFSVRVLPQRGDLVSSQEMALIVWD
jgi:starch phosphorylase